MATQTIDNRPTSFSGIVPYVQVSDAAAAAELYKRVFGAEEYGRMAASDGKKILHLALRINGADLFINDPFPEAGYPLQAPQAFTLHLQVDDAEAWFARAAKELEVVKPLEVAFWGDKYGQLRDRFGVRWSIGGPNR